MKNSDIDAKGYKGNINLKRINQEIDWTPELVQEYVKCSEDPVYFIETYMKIINVNEGLVNFNLYDYQKQMIRGFQDNRFNIITTARQAGKALPLDTKIPSPSGWKTMGDGQYTSDRMNELVGKNYGDMMNGTQQVPSSDPMSQFLNKDYSKVLEKSMEKSKNKLGR